MVDEIAVFTKSVRMAEVLAVESRFPSHPHIKNNVLSGDEIFESVPFIPQSLIGIFRIGLAFPVPLPELFLVLVFPVGEQTSEHHPEHLDSIHFYQFLSLTCALIIAQDFDFVKHYFLKVSQKINLNPIIPITKITVRTNTIAELSDE